MDKSGGSLLCANGHCHDIAKSGYVNLLMSQKSSTRNHGDDKEMLLARRDFLSKGYYSHLRELLCETTAEYTPNGSLILDCGCGEGYYTEGIAEAVPNSDVVGIDISKDALKYASKRGIAELAAASAYKLPLADSSCGAVLSVFAPYSAEELLRVLKHNGVFIEAAPLPGHLMSLKKAVYENAYENDMPPIPNGFTLIKRHELKRNIRLTSAEDIRHLFSMTPYSHKTLPSDIAKLESLNELETETEFCVSIYMRSTD